MGFKLEEFIFLVLGDTLKYWGLEQQYWWQLLGKYNFFFQPDEYTFHILFIIFCLPEEDGT